MANRLSLNIDKTCYMVFPLNKNNEISSCVCVDGIEIKKESHCRCLGVIIDDQLKWIEHMQYVYNKIIRCISMFYKFKDKLPVLLLTDLYYTFVQPHICNRNICKHLPNSFRKTYEIR